jgi:hypothetical protein
MLIAGLFDENWNLPKQTGEPPLHPNDSGATRAQGR